MFIAIAHAAESAKSAGGGIGALGIDGKMFLFQVINFVILLFILRAVAYRPILHLLEERRQKIAASVKAAEAIEVEKKNLARKQQTIMEETYRKADAILDSAKKEASTILAAAEQKAKQRSEQVIAEAQKEIDQLYRQRRLELKKETLGLVAHATEQVIEQKLDGKQDEALVGRALEQALLNSRRGNS